MKDLMNGIAEISKMSVLELAEVIVNLTIDEGDVDPNGASAAFSQELANRLGISPIQALLLSVFVNQCDDTRIRYKDIANHFEVRPIKILAIANEIDDLVERGALLKRKDRDGDITYRMPSKVIENLRKGVLPTPEPKTGLDVRELMELLFHYLELRDNDELEDEDLYHYLHEAIESNQQLPLSQNLMGLKLDDSDLVLFLAMCMIYINDHDEHIARCDIDDYFDRRTLRKHTLGLENGTHDLMRKHLVEHSCDDGQADTERWRITNHTKSEVLVGLNLATKKENRANVTRHEDIVEKKLFYNERVTKQVDDLKSLLDGEKMKRVMQRLKDRGMRRGFTCLFYGAPGTGKTETVQQLARMTGRDIMLVDVPNIRSKWVGETEQNIKAVFERYARLAKTNDMAPILLFNEADALLNKRAEGATGSVDKMENAMQNIILQEMENLEGIMIATTNLTGSLDAAFERRFLYKIEFEKPTPQESKHIWRSMLPDLSEEQALNLAESFAFSGGQIENIARKQAISSILADEDTLSIDRVREACRQESLHKSTTRQIGFAS